MFYRESKQSKSSYLTCFIEKVNKLNPHTSHVFIEKVNKVNLHT